MAPEASANPTCQSLGPQHNELIVATNKIPVAPEPSFRLALWLGAGALFILACLLICSMAMGSR